jgi:hypothetical protein
LRTSALIVLITLTVVQVWSCSSTTDGELKENKPPTVWLSGAPPEGSLESYIIKFYWGGWDPDGEISHYQFCITDNKEGNFDPADTTGSDMWETVIRNDSTFSFTADVLEENKPDDQVAEFRRSHTFFIRAVDKTGTASTQPAYRSFTSRTLSPEVNITIPVRKQLTPAEVPPITTFRWTATDYISSKMLKQDPDSISFLLEPLALHNNDWNETIGWVRGLPVDSKEWGEWFWYKTPNDSGKFWTTPPQDRGNYLFAIRAKDEAGAITPVFDEEKNIRRILVSNRTTGPILTVTNRYMGGVKTAVCSTPLTIIDIPAGIPLEFKWEADASSYGGTEAGYRYGWDIADLTDPSQWEVDLTPFPPRPLGETAKAKTALARTFYFGTHVFTIEVVDNSGFCSRVEVKVNIVQFTMVRDLLLVDDFPESEWSGWNHLQGKGTEPTDEEHDEFWNQILSNVEGFDPSEDVVDVESRAGAVVQLRKLALYKSIIWNTKGDRAMQSGFPGVHELIKFRPKENEATSGKQQPNLVALFMAAGGHILYCGQHPLSMAIDGTYVPVAMRYPAIYKYDLDQRVYRQDRPPNSVMVQNPPGDQSFPYVEMCLETIDYAITSTLTRRPPGHYCPVHREREVPDNPVGNAEYKRTRSMRAAMPLDPNFPRLVLRPETAAPGKAHDPNVSGLDVEVYNPAYFFELCVGVHAVRDCFEPIYGLECFETTEPTYGEAIAFWTSTFADVIASAHGAIPAKSAVLGFPPVMCDTLAIRGAIEHIMFDEWQLQRSN